MLAGLTVLTLVVFWWVQPENRLNIDEDAFRVPGLNEISRVELASDTGVVKLAFDGARWRVNDRFDADGSMIRVLFATLQQATPKRPVSRSGRDSVFSAVSESGIKVSLYAGDDLRKEFFAGGNAAKTQAFFADPETREVYVMTIPGYRVYVSGILELGVNGWRDKFVFRFNWRNFKSLAARFPGKPSENFTVEKMTDFFGIPGLSQTDTSRLNTFLDNLSLLTVDEYLSEPKLTDSLKGVAPDMEITVTDIGNRDYHLLLFDAGSSKHGYGLIRESETALIDRRKIRPLLKPKSFFQKK